MDAMSIVLMAVVLVGMMVFMSMSDKKKKKKAAEMRDSLSVGDSITTIGGLYGKIVHVSADRVTFETSEDRVRVEIAKWAIQSTGKIADETPAQ